MDHGRHTRLSRTEITEAVLADAPVYGPGDQKVGTISHLHGAGASGGVVVDVGGFLGIGSKPVLIGLDQLDVMRDEDGEVHAVTAWTRDQLKDLPEHRH